MLSQLEGHSTNLFLEQHLSFPCGHIKKDRLAAVLVALAADWPRQEALILHPGNPESCVRFSGGRPDFKKLDAHTGAVTLIQRFFKYGVKPEEKQHRAISKTTEIHVSVPLNA